MINYNFNKATPFEATHAGELIKDELVARKMKMNELSRLTGIQRFALHDVIKGKCLLTAEMARLLEKALGIPAYLFLNIQTQCEVDKTKQNETAMLPAKRLQSCPIH
jgi:HTH-type transcriptional regulator / antitoxin HigA